MMSQLGIGIHLNGPGGVVSAVDLSTLLSFTPVALYDSRVGVYTDAGSTPAGNNGLLQQWNDQSGNSYHLTQATTAKKPTYKTAIQNGLAVARFDGVSTFMTSPAFSSVLAQPATIFIVHATVGSQTLQIYMDGLTLANRNSVFWQTGNDWMHAGASFGYAHSIPYSCVQQCCIFNGASSNFYQDGVQKNAGTPGTEGIDGITVGTRFSQDQGFAQMDLCCLAIYSGAMGTTNRQTIETYLRSTWGTA